METFGILLRCLLVVVCRNNAKQDFMRCVIRDTRTTFDTGTTILTSKIATA